MKLLFLLACLVRLQSAFGGDACVCDQDKFTALEEQLVVLTKQLHLENEQLQLQNEQLQLQNEEIHTLKKTAKPRHEVEDQIAFSVVSHNTFGPVTVDTNIPFPVVYTNAGGGWNAVINAFHVIKAGVYLFTTSFRGSDSGNTFASIVHTTASDSRRVATLSSNRDLYTGDANSAIIHVAAGDYVSVQLHAGSSVIDSTPTYVYTTFSGHFLFP